MGSVDGALRKAGWWDEEMFLLMGMTGMAFHFIIHATACSSVTVYDWGLSISPCWTIGIHNEVVVVMNISSLNTRRQVQEDVLAKYGLP